MQTLRSRRSPCKYKNEPARFLGDGMTFKAKLIGILEVSEARGDKMCQDALNDLKTAIRAAGEHKQRITISIAIDGLRLRDEKTGDSMYHHPVHKISFIAQDMSDSRAFGYIFGSPDTGHRFFGIKTDKTASQVVIAMRDLFQVVFELKKKEIEMTKRHIELHQSHFSGESASKEEADIDKIKSETSHRTKMSTASKTARDGPTYKPEPAKTSNAPSTSKTGAIADLLDLEDELNSIQQGISQMDRITPSDPFGPLSLKGDSFLDSFKNRSSDGRKPGVLLLQKTAEGDSRLFGSGGAPFFPDTSSPVTVAKPKEEQHWFDQETESLFRDAVANVAPPDTSASPVTFHTPTGDDAHSPEALQDEKKSTSKKFDIFTDLDPLGTGKTKPYLDKKDFFQELKNPPKKVLKELISEPSQPDPSSSFANELESQPAFKNPGHSNNFQSSIVSNSNSSGIPTFIDSCLKDPRYSKIDPFEDMDPFDKTDPFLEDSFPKSIGFPSLGTRSSVESQLDRPGYRTDRATNRTPEEKWIDSPPKSSIFSSSIHGPLRVSLPPEKADSNTTISLSSLASRFRTSPSPTDDSKTLKRKNYQTLKHSFDDKSDDQSNSPIFEEVCVRSSPKPFASSSFDKKILIGSPPPPRSDRLKSKISSSLELLDSTPDPPPRPKATLFAIKPPPLPPKKQNQPNFRPPARPPSLEDNCHYDYLRQKTALAQKEDAPTSPSKVKSVSMGRQNSFENVSNFPILPKPPQRKSSVGSDSRTELRTTPTLTNGQYSSKKEPSVLDITLNQLDQSGIENLATSLGISTENVSNMTLQELTKMLANKYLGSNGTPQEKSGDSETFKADFVSNFSNMGGDSPSYDKYAVFKELIEEDSEQIQDEKGFEDSFEDAPNTESLSRPEVTENTAEIGESEGDKYAALRHLSLSAQKSDNLSEDLDISNEEDSSGRADNISDIIKPPTDESITPLHNPELTNDSPITRPGTEDNEDEKDKLYIAASWNEEDNVSSVQKTDSKDLPADNNLNENDWADFQKEEMPATPIQEEPVLTDKNADNKISPISSDGRGEPNIKQFEWENKESPGKECPWLDEDESWDEHSAKESYWSDESSHDGRSPAKENMPYHRKTWNKHPRSSKPIIEKSKHWQRCRWQDDTEDEYEEMRRRRRRPAPLQSELGRKRDFHEGDRWRGDRWESWVDDRRGHGERRNLSSEARRRLDSDCSDKEYRATEKVFDHPPGAKSKHYLGQTRGETERHRPEVNREPRSKYKRPSNHKRPSSASDAWRYDTYATIDSRSPNKEESDEDDYHPRFRPSRKDLRYHSNIEHYESYDRRAQATHQRQMHRGKRMKNIEDPRWLESRHFLAPETPRSAQSEDTPEATKELHFKFEDDFTPSPTESQGKDSQINTPKTPVERLVRDDWGRAVPRKVSLPATDNNNDTFASFEDEFQTSSKSKEQGVLKKPSLKGRSKLGRQDSSASLRKSESINIFSRESDPFEDDDFFCTGSNAGGDAKFGKFFAEKSKSNSNVNDPFAWKEMYRNNKFEN